MQNIFLEIFSCIWLSQSPPHPERDPAYRHSPPLSSKSQSVAASHKLNYRRHPYAGSLSGCLQVAIKGLRAAADKYQDQCTLMRGRSNCHQLRYLMTSMAWTEISPSLSLSAEQHIALSDTIKCWGKSPELSQTTADEYQKEIHPFFPLSLTSSVVLRLKSQFGTRWCVHTHTNTTFTMNRGTALTCL